MEIENTEVSPIRDRDDNLESLRKYTRHRRSVEEKLTCVERIENGERLKYLSKELGVATCTLRAWVKNKKNLQNPKPSKSSKQQTVNGELTIKQETGLPDSETNIRIDQIMSTVVTSTPKQKPKPKPKLTPVIVKEPDIPQLVNDSLLKWYENCHQRGVPVTRERFEVKTAYYFKKHGISNFYMTNEWLFKWMKQHAFKLHPESLESISAAEMTDTDFQRELKQTLGYVDHQKCQVFNCSVLAWNYKSLPLSLGHQIEKEHHQDDYMKVFSFSNADMSLKIPLIFTINSGKRKCYKNEFNVPLYSTELETEILDPPIFKHWLDQEFIPQVMKFLSDRQLPPKALLILDKDIFDAAHLDQGDFKSVVIPKGFTFLTKPFDSEIVPLMKDCKHSFLKKITEMIRENSSIPLIQHLESINHGHFLAWIKTHWQRGIDSIDISDMDLVRNLPGGMCLSPESIERWLRKCQPEIIEKNHISPVVVKTEHDPDVISTEEATSYIDKLLSYFAIHKIMEAEGVIALTNAKQRIIEMSQIVSP